jgi:hypothetical protein
VEEAACRDRRSDPGSRRRAQAADLSGERGRLVAPTLPIQPVHDAGSCGELAERGIKSEGHAVGCSCRPRVWVSKKGSADRADGEGQHAAPADEKTYRQEKFGIAGAEEADSRGEGQEATPDVAPNPGGAKERRPGFKKP